MPNYITEVGDNFSLQVFENKMADTTVILQAISIAANFLTIVSLVITAGLFGNAYFSANTETDVNSRYCPLYLNHENVSKNPPCVIALIFEVLAASGLLVLIKASIWKLIRQDFKLVPNLKFLDQVIYLF